MYNRYGYNSTARTQPLEPMTLVIVLTTGETNWMYSSKMATLERTCLERYILVKNQIPSYLPKETKLERSFKNVSQLKTSTEEEPRSFIFLLLFY